MASRNLLQQALQKPYDRILFSKEVLTSLFNSNLKLLQAPVPATIQPTASEKSVIDKVTVYGSVLLEDHTEITCYEILLQPTVRIEQSKVAIQHYVRKLLTSGQAGLINFISPQNKKVWRLTLVAKDSELTKEGVKEKFTHTKRYTFLLGPGESCKTVAERFETLSIEKQIDLKALVKAFSVEKLSKAFFNEYKLHYQKFIAHLNESNFKKSAFKGDEKRIRDFVKKLLGRLVFLSFVQKKGWLGATSTAYNDGDPNFLMNMFIHSGANETFYEIWLKVLFFDTLNNHKGRPNDDFTLPNKRKVKIPFLNGGLFDKEDIDDKMLTFNPKLFHNADNNEDPKLRGFLDFLGAFNFTVYEDSPDDHTVAVDPEMLGHIFENLLEDNKDRGAFYTPKEIVHYMCQESLIEYLITQLSKEFTVYRELGNDQVELTGNEERKEQSKALEELGDKALNRADVEFIVKQKDISRLTKAHLHKMSHLLDTIKICDPAIGSGAFPMGLLLEIFGIKEVIAYTTGTSWDPAQVKENIIQNSVYGVDIEKGAVDIARLRFWLSLVVDEDKPKALPNLDYKIVVGNSLVSKFEDEIIQIDWEIKEGTQGNIFGNDSVLKRHELLKSISKKQKDYFQPENTTKKELAAEIRNLKIDILINQLELMISTKGIEKHPSGTGKKIKEQTELYLQTVGWKQSISRLKSLKKQAEKSFHHFDWKLDFPEILNSYLVGSEAGFDIVIGNPPYIQLQKMGKDSEDLERAGYETFERTGDIYSLFYELGFKILKSNGILTYITSNKWMRAAYGESLRKHFAAATNPVVLIDFGGFQVFETATVDTNILVSKKARFENKINTCVLGKGFDLKYMSGYFSQNSSITSFTSDQGWVVLSSIEKSIKTKIENVGTPLREWDINIYRGILTGYNEAFIIDSSTREQLIRTSPKSAEIIRPILLGKDIKRYTHHWNGLWLINSHNGVKNLGLPKVDLKVNYPAVYEHIRKHKEKLIRRLDQGDHWSNLRNCAYLKEFDRPKIAWGNLSLKSQFTFIPDACLINAPSPFFASDNLYLLAILNSRVGEYYIKTLGVARSGGYIEFKPMFVEQLPIPIISEESQMDYANIVKQILNSKKIGEDTQDLEQELDYMIFELYRLNNPEIDHLLSID